MAKKNDVALVFDLDGTIAPYKKPVPKKIADYLNTLGRIYVITGGRTDYAKKACKRLKNAIVVGTGNIYDSLDLAKGFSQTKESFHKSKPDQIFRKNIVCVLRNELGGEVYTGGRSTIDFMPKGKNKADIAKKLVGKKKIIFFYDNKWDFLIPYSNDYPLIEIAHRSIRTNWKRVIRDIKANV